MRTSQASAWADRIAANVDALRHNPDQRALVKASRTLWELSAHAWMELWGLHDLPAQHADSALVLAADEDGLLVVADPSGGPGPEDLSAFAREVLSAEASVSGVAEANGWVRALRPHPSLPELLWWWPSADGPRWVVARVDVIVLDE